MKNFTLFAVVVSTIVALPILVKQAQKRIPILTDEDKRYDIEDLIAEESL